MIPDNVSSSSKRSLLRRRLEEDDPTMDPLTTVVEDQKESEGGPVYKLDRRMINKCELHYNVDFDPLALKMRIDKEFPAAPDP